MSRSRHPKHRKLPKQRGGTETLRSPAIGARWLVLVGLGVVLICTTAAVVVLRRDGLREESNVIAERTEPFTVPRRPALDDADGAEAKPADVLAMRDECFDVAEKLVETYWDNPHAYVLLGMVHARYLNEAGAVALWHHCLELDPKCADAYHALGLNEQKKGQHAEAERNLAEAYRIDPHWNELPMPYAKALVAQGKLQQAVGVLEEYLQYDATMPAVWCYLAQLYHQSKDYQNAKRVYGKVLAESPDHTEAHYGMALALQGLGLADEAREYLDRFRELNARLEVEVGRARAAKELDLSRAEGVLKSLCIAGGKLHAHQGNLTSAEETWKRVLEIDTEHRETLELLCDLYSKQKRIDDAIQVRRKLRDLDPHSPRHWYNLGMLYVQNGEADKAEVPFRRVIKLAPQAPDGYAALAQLQMMPGGDIKESLQLARTAIDLAPDAPNYFVLSAVLLTAGDKAGALAAMRRAIELDPNDHRYREGLARLMQEQPQ